MISYFPYGNYVIILYNFCLITLFAIYHFWAIWSKRCLNFLIAFRALPFPKLRRIAKLEAIGVTASVAKARKGQCKSFIKFQLAVEDAIGALASAAFYDFFCNIKLCISD